MRYGLFDGLIHLPNPTLTDPTLRRNPHSQKNWFSWQECKVTGQRKKGKSIAVVVILIHPLVVSAVSDLAVLLLIRISISSPVLNLKPGFHRR